MKGVPKPSGYDQSDVTNPKDVVSQGLTNAQVLGPQIDNIMLEMSFSSYDGNGQDLVDSLVLPVVMIAEGVDSMEKVVATADQIEAAEEKAILMAFLSALFLFIPLVGEAIGTIAELANIGRIVALLGESGNTALDIYDVVSGDDNAPLAIFGRITAPLALSDLVAVGKAADLKRAMKADDVASLGKNIELRITTAHNINGACTA